MPTPSPRGDAATLGDETALRLAIHARIREDVPLAGKMNLYPKHVDALMPRLAALRSADDGRDGGAEAMRVAAIACALRVGRELGEPSIGYRISNAIQALPLDPPPAPDTAGRTEP